jgi:uncharacterized membrane protein YphA (DoxX/SURF4 family)
MRHIVTLARILLGLVFFVFGLNGFLNFIPMPPPQGAGAAFLGALAATGYLFPLLMATQTLSGLLLLTGRWVPLALTLLAPVVVNIVAYHLALDPAGLPLALFALGLGVFLAWAYRDSFRTVVAYKAGPSVARPAAAEQQRATSSSLPPRSEARRVA